MYQYTFDEDTTNKIKEQTGKSKSILEQFSEVDNKYSSLNNLGKSELNLEKLNYSKPSEEQIKSKAENSLSNYKNSLNFIKSVKQARKWEPNIDNLVIFAGACQSNYEQLIRAGANYASSPGRIMIHALDPVFVVEKIACSRIDTIVPIEEVIEQTVTGIKGIGGCETRGKFRWAMPKSMLY